MVDGFMNKHVITLHSVWLTSEMIPSLVNRWVDWCYLQEAAVSLKIPPQYSWQLKKATFLNQLYHRDFLYSSFLLFIWPQGWDFWILQLKKINIYLMCVCTHSHTHTPHTCSSCTIFHSVRITLGLCSLLPLWVLGTFTWKTISPNKVLELSEVSWA